ncbi:MAG: hypothetical protein P8Y36_02595 [Alphaproteobacteria bacterium]
MRKSLVLSAILHLILLVVVVLNFSSSSKPPAVVQPVAVNVVEPSDVSQIKAGNSDNPHKDKDTKSAAADKPDKKPEPAPTKSVENSPTSPKAKAAEVKPAKAPTKSAGTPPPPKAKTKTASAAATATPPLPKPRPVSRKPQTQKPAHKQPVRKPAIKKSEIARLDRDRPDEHDDAPRRKPWKKIEPRLPSEGDQYEEDRLESQPLSPRRMARRDDEPPVHDRDRDDEGEYDPENADDTRDRDEPEPRRLRSSMNAAKSKFDSRRIAALIDRRKPTASTPRSRHDEPSPRKPWRNPGSFQDQVSSMTGGGTQPSGRPIRDRSRHNAAERQGSPDGDSNRLSANEIDAFRAQVSRCWTPPVGGLGADAIIVKLHIMLNKDGTLAHPPRVKNRVNSPFFTPAADSALRAVLQCEPYRMPPEKFSQWRDMLLTFDPRQMYGG